MTRYASGRMPFGLALVLALPLTLSVSGSAASAQPADGTLKFIGSEIPLGPIVRGAPYSADATTTLTQTLGDGTRINRTVTARLYRDSEGRVRREQTVVGLGALDPSAEAQPIVTIMDPVAQVQYVLDPRRHEAHRLAMMSVDARSAALGQKLLQAGVPGKKVELFMQGPPPPPPPPPGGPGSAGSPGSPGSPGSHDQRLERRSKSAAAAQSLGHRQLEGLDAVGTRRSETIPAGKIGNDRPIEVSDERWESPDLGLLMLSEHHDPRTGDVEYRLSNINRSEPPRDLFAVPGDYTVVEMPPPPPPPPPPPAPPRDPALP